MKLYRFSPIESQEQLIAAIEHTHFACSTLCQKSFGKYLPVAGNIGIFCHYNNEFEYLKTLRQRITRKSSDPNQKYFELIKPIIIAAKDGVPEATYTHLYIRRPDIYRSQVGDIDFYLQHRDYSNLKQDLAGGKRLEGARIFPREDLDMIELYDPDVDALGYVSTNTMTKKVRVKLSEETKL